MTDKVDIAELRARADDAKELLENKGLKAALAKIEANCVTQLKQTPSLDRQIELIAMMKVLDTIEGALKAVLKDHAVAVGPGMIRRA